jgi:hypothetical protein
MMFSWIEFKQACGSCYLVSLCRVSIGWAELRILDDLLGGEVRR